MSVCPNCKLKVGKGSPNKKEHKTKGWTHKKCPNKNEIQADGRSYRINNK